MLFFRMYKKEKKMKLIKFLIDDFKHSSDEDRVVFYFGLPLFALVLIFMIGMFANLAIA